MKYCIYILFLLPLTTFAQINISGRVLNQADAKPVVNASVFISNASIGSRSENDGTFVLHNVKPGSYKLVISVVGFETYDQDIIVENQNISLPDILIFPKTIALSGITIKPHDDPNREKYLNSFKDEFLGTSLLANECRILNPDVLDLNYDEASHTLTASSYDFLQIENDALGYRVKYLLTDFTLNNIDENHKTISYKGSVLFEELKGTPSQQRRRQRARQQVYENSPMHFLRSALAGRLDEDGYRVFGATYTNPDRPSDSLINANIKLYKLAGSGYKDSLSYWIKKSKLPLLSEKITSSALSKNDIVKETGQPGRYSLGYNGNALYVAYDKSRHFYVNNKFDYLYNAGNTNNTLIKFNAPYAVFYRNGVIINPYSVVYYGVWGRRRVAEMLPIDFEPAQGSQVSQDDIENGITSKLATWLSSHVSEKVHLHFDKPYYAAGDTIYFKAYVTQGEKHELSTLSGVLHVDLISSNHKISQSLKLHLDSGVAWGDFTLPDSLSKGDYRVRAYTRLMRNDGDDAYFEQTIPVGSALSNHIPESGLPHINNPANLQNAKADVQFLPEGGRLVQGVRSKVAFKAIGKNGLGCNIKGELVDDQNKTVASFSSAHLGMGYFELTPQEGRNYNARVSYDDGTSDVFDLPKAAPYGIIMSINNDSLPKATVRIEASKSYYLANKNKDYLLLIYSGGKAITISCTLDNPVFIVDILKRRLATGIATVTLFSPKGEPLCERLLFVQNYDRLNMDISSDKTVYAKREKVTLKLDVKDRAGNASAGHFSVSITDEHIVPGDENSENSILTDLLLTSGLKGFVEQPNYYFADASGKANKDLDLVMLTHGYRRFEWKQVLNNIKPEPTWLPEKGIEISGIAKNALGAPLKNGIVSLILPAGGPVLSDSTDARGHFSFNNLVFTDSAKFILQAVNANGKSSTSLVYNKEKEGPATLPIALSRDNDNQPNTPYLENTLKQHDQAVQYGTATGKMLKEVKIRQSKKHIIDDSYRSSSLLGPGHADQVIRRKDFRGGGLFTDQFSGTLRGVKFNEDPKSHKKIAVLTMNAAMDLGAPGGNDRSHAASGMLVIVDGALLRGIDINTINVNNIETIEVYKSANASIYGIDAGNGVLIITTRQGGADLDEIHAVGILPIAVSGFYKAREFYAPRYDHPEDNLKRPDLRSTIFWKPELQTDKDGKASFDFYNADGTGTYRVVIEGIDDNGNLGRLVYRYTVE